MAGHRAFSSVCSNGDMFYYAIQAVDATGNATGEWEIGYGSYTSLGNMIARDTVLASSNSNNAVMFSGGTKHVWIDVPATQLIALNYNVANATGTYNETAVYGNKVIFANATAGAVTINLPTAVGNLARFTIKKIDSTANTVTIDPNGAQTIDGSPTAVIRVENVSLDIISNGTNWYVV
jgi:hypothetical protein